ncbi:outer membrane protein [Microvirga calopogonii]|uniref:outer membrane protein n=1 Tax=Microvirga calopogonii TaxID=2078013 RepID=UPI000E0D3673|nr:outer membrane protein [Microvirga calopogonii]
MRYRSFLSLAACAAMAMLAMPAAAADLPFTSQPVPVPALTAVGSGYNWTGFYAGVNAGYGWTNSDDVTVSGSEGFFFNDAAFGGFNTTGGDGFTGGAQVGYNYQFGKFVVGAEADINYADQEIRSFGALDSAFVNESLEFRSELEWFGTVRARIGFVPVDRFLVYATGGLAYGSVDVSATDTLTLPRLGRTEIWSGKDSDTKFGWTLGAGAEYAITNNLTARLEGLYVDLEDTKVAGAYTGDTAILAEDTFTAKADNKFTVLRAGLNYKF